MSSLLHCFQDAEAKLAACPLFECQVIKEPPVDASELDVIEARLGIRLPELLREFYRTVAARYGLYWNIVRDRWVAAGYDAEICEWGQAEFCDARSLKVGGYGFDGLVQITTAGVGDGWWLDLRSDAPFPVVWAAHDTKHRFGETLPNVETLVDEFVPRLIARHVDLQERMESFFETGTYCNR